MPISGDEQDLERHVERVFEVARRFKWGELRKRIPVGYDYTRPTKEGAYMAVGWRARWVDQVDGPIVIEVAGWRDPDHHYPLYARSEVVERAPTF